MKNDIKDCLESKNRPKSARLRDDDRNKTKANLSKEKGTDKNYNSVR